MRINNEEEKYSNADGLGNLIGIAVLGMVVIAGGIYYAMYKKYGAKGLLYATGGFVVVGALSRMNHERRIKGMANRTAPAQSELQPVYDSEGNIIGYKAK
jgi:hypothetical protein